MRRTWNQTERPFGFLCEVRKGWVMLKGRLG